MNYFFEISTLHEFEVTNMTFRDHRLCEIYIVRPVASGGAGGALGQNKFIGVLRKQEQTTMPQVKPFSCKI